MYVKVITPFYGVVEERNLIVGEVLEVEDDRGYVMAERELVVAADKPPKPKAKRKRRKVAKKKRRKATKPPEDKAERPEENKVVKPGEDKSEGEGAD